MNTIAKTPDNEILSGKTPDNCKTNTMSHPKIEPEVPELKDFEELAHAYFEPGDKDYWDGIEFGKDYLKKAIAEDRKRVRERIESGISLYKYYGVGGEVINIKDLKTLLK